eukprot:COSAG01_NODE_9375_length_2463_cov_251.083756_1_plen_151_part_10
MASVYLRNLEERDKGLQEAMSETQFVLRGLPEPSSEWRLAAAAAVRKHEQEQAAASRSSRAQQLGRKALQQAESILAREAGGVTRATDPTPGEETQQSILSNDKYTHNIQQSPLQRRGDSIMAEQREAQAAHRLASGRPGGPVPTASNPRL